MLNIQYLCFKHCNAVCTSCGKGYVHKWDNPRNNTNKATSLSNYYCYNCCKLFRKNRLLLAQNNANKINLVANNNNNKQLSPLLSSTNNLQSPRQLIMNTTTPTNETS